VSSSGRVEASHCDEHLPAGTRAIVFMLPPAARDNFSGSVLGEFDLPVLSSPRRPGSAPRSWPSTPPNALHTPTHALAAPLPPAGGHRGTSPGSSAGPAAQPPASEGATTLHVFICSRLNAWASNGDCLPRPVLRNGLWSPPPPPTSSRGFPLILFPSL